MLAESCTVDETLKIQVGKLLLVPQTDSSFVNLKNIPYYVPHEILSL